ncbi:cellulase, partial [Aureobasidium melanogenum]
MAPHADTDATSTQNAAHFSNPPCSMLHVEGADIVDASGSKVILKGAGLGGHLNFENFITGYPGHEHEHRAAMAEVLGKEKAQFFFDRLIHYFFTDADAAYFQSLGLNCIRIPFNYRHFIDDDNPSVIKDSGFKLLDNIVDICGRHNLYVILDLHAVPGGQNQDWHCDSGIGKALFWEFRVFQDQMIDLWVHIAKHYVGNPVIAGYNPLNEPADPKHVRLIAWYDRMEKAIREVDPDHILWVDGNTYAMDFSHFTRIMPNTVYACHDYANMGFPIPGQDPYTGTEEQNAKLRRQFNRKAEFSRKHNVPLWNGEFGPVYADPSADPDADKTNISRFGVLKEQLNIYAESQIHWTIWLYKDIGYQGMVHVSRSSPYMQLIKSFVAKKQRLGLDFWGVVDKTGVSSTYDPFLSDIKKMIPEHLHDSKYPHHWDIERQFERVVRECLVSDYLNLEFAELFKGKSEQELDDLAASFKFENCVTRDKLTEICRLMLLNTAGSDHPRRRADEGLDRVVYKWLFTEDEKSRIEARLRSPTYYINFSICIYLTTANKEWNFTEVMEDISDRLPPPHLINHRIIEGLITSILMEKPMSERKIKTLCQKILAAKKPYVHIIISSPSSAIALSALYPSALHTSLFFSTFSLHLYLSMPACVLTIYSKDQQPAPPSLHVQQPAPRGSKQGRKGRRRQDHSDRSFHP